MDIYGVIGWPVKHSLSPAMHNAAFKKLGIDAEYKKFEVRPEGLEDFLLNRKDVVGFNITVPHKVKAREMLETKFSSDQTKEVLYYVQVSGAINTVKRDANKLLYLNTDVYGFRRALTEDLKFEPKDKNALLIGCGGAGRAIVAGVIWEGGGASVNKIYIYENNDKALESAEKHFSKFSVTKEKLEFISSKEISSVINKCQLLVNATPVGMKVGNKSVIDKKLLHKDLYVYDVVYNRETELIKYAKSLHLRAVGGLSMLLYQGMRAFEFWTGKQAPIDVMKEALLKGLK